jgi:hypothetical protein
MNRARPELQYLYKGSSGKRKGEVLGDLSASGKYFGYVRICRNPGAIQKQSWTV